MNNLKHITKDEQANVISSLYNSKHNFIEHAKKQTGKQKLIFKDTTFILEFLWHKANTKAQH